MLPVRVLAILLIALTVGTAQAAVVTPKRSPQDYRAPERDRGADKALLWIPRVVFFPPWLVSEYLIRRPVGAFVEVAEREQWPVQVTTFFTFGERRQITLFPSAFLDFGLKPSVGFNLGWKYFLAEPNALRVHFGTWGPGWLTTKIVDTYALDARQSLALEGRLVRRKDFPFYGMGPESTSNLTLRYQATTVEAASGYELSFFRSSRFASRAGVRTLTFGDETCCADPSVRSAVDSGAVAEPPGLDDDYVAAFQALTVTLDTRKPRPNDRSGVRLEGRGEAVFVPGSEHGRRSWVTYGASAGAALDVWRARTVALNVRADLADPLIGTIPFTDQISLGGERPMRGFLQNRLIDRSAVVGTVQYTWPVWVFLDGVLQADVGNVFGERLAGFDFGLLRLSTGIGIRSNGEHDSGFEFLVAGGTDPFDHGFRVSSFRFAIGSHHGF